MRRKAKGVRETFEAQVYVSHDWPWVYNPWMRHTIFYLSDGFKVKEGDRVLITVEKMPAPRGPRRKK
jgi:hypothetical protein